MIITNVQGLRDPFILLDNGIYYLYGTGTPNGDWDSTIWDCYKNTSGKLDGKWEKIDKLIYQKPNNALKQFWAPEVHKYKDAYYMLCSYYSSETNFRGSTIMKATSPTGPFVEISNGHITPHDRDCIDATLYIDNQNNPWLIFVYEWTSTNDGIGRMAAARLSDDLSQLITKPVELFRADSPLWTNMHVTDGCFLHTLSNGHIIMLWSNFEADGYCIGIAHSKDGNIDGEWLHEDSVLYKKGTFDNHDGGHGMIFKDTNGKLYLCCHSPNSPCDECKERTIIIPISEQNNTICIK